MAKVYKHISRPEHNRPARQEQGIGEDETIDAGTLRTHLRAGGLTLKMNTVTGSLIAEEILNSRVRDTPAGG